MKALKANQKSALKTGVISDAEGNIHSKIAANQTKIDWKTQGTSAANQTKSKVNASIKD